MNERTFQALSVLYVEDDEALARITTRRLEQYNLNVDHYDNISDASAAIANKTFDWALLDLKVGSESSLQLVELLVEAAGNTKSVVLTGYGSIATAVKAIKLGAHNYLTKPASVEDIISSFTDSSVNTGRGVHNSHLNTPSLKEIEWESIQKALDENLGNVSATARQLKMHRRTLQRKLQKKQQR